MPLPTGLKGGLLGVEITIGTQSKDFMKKRVKNMERRLIDLLAKFNQF